MGSPTDREDLCHPDAHGHRNTHQHLSWCPSNLFRKWVESGRAFAHQRFILASGILVVCCWEGGWQGASQGSKRPTGPTIPIFLPGYRRGDDDTNFTNISKQYSCKKSTTMSTCSLYTSLQKQTLCTLFKLGSMTFLAKVLYVPASVI